MLREWQRSKMTMNEGYYTEKGSFDAEGWAQEGNSVIEEKFSFTSSHVCRMKGQDSSTVSLKGSTVGLGFRK